MENHLEVVNWWKTWSPNMAYVLGFIYADGSVCSDRNSRITIAQKDPKILTKIADTIPRDNKKAFLRNKSTGIYYLAISMPNLRQILSRYGIVINKTEYGFWPPSIPYNVLPHYIRGFFDGDGYIGLIQGETSKRGVVTFACHLRSYLAELSKNLNKMGLSVRRPYLNDRHHINYILAYRTKLDVIKLYDLFYRDADIYLERKRERFKCVLDYYESTASPFGSGHHAAKITENDVIKIRQLYNTGGYTQKQIGEQFGINDRNVSMIVNRKSWRHV